MKTNIIKLLLPALAATALTTQAAPFEGIHGYVGSGYKFIEPDFGSVTTGRNPSARFGLYGKWGQLKAGVDHHSQWRDGRPFNDRQEYHKTELFIDYELCLFLCRGGK